MGDSCVEDSVEAGIRWADYLVFGGMLVLSSAVGVIYGFFTRKKHTSNEFFLGNRRMSCLPVSLSVAATLTNGILMLGLPAEIYLTGTQMIVNSFVSFITVPIVTCLYFPVFRKLSLTSSYEYLNLRFNNTLRCIASTISLLISAIFSSISIYAAGLALNQVTGWNIYVVIAITFGVCILYTSMGGIKAVMWTDALQTVIIFGAQIAIIVRGSVKVGGGLEAWKRIEDSGRVEFFNLDPDPTVRLTFWTTLGGGTINFLTFLTGSQGVIQRYLSVPTLKAAQTSIVAGTMLLVLSILLSSYIAILLFANYFDCDPLSAKRIRSPDQLLPLFVLDVMGDLPGFPGLFVAGLFSAALSTVSTLLNSMATVTVKDFVMPKWKLSDEKELQLAKFFSVVYGLIAFALVFLIEQLGTILQLTWAITAIGFGAICSMFTLGMFYPWCNSTGAIVGTISGMAFMVWIEVGSQLAKANGLIAYPWKPLSVDGCACNVSSIVSTRPPVKGKVLPLYEVSFLWYASISLTISVATGLLVSFLTSPRDPRELDPDLLSPGALWVFEKLPTNIKKKLGLEFNNNRKLTALVNTSESEDRATNEISANEENCSELQSLRNNC